MNSKWLRAYYLTQGFESTLALFPIERVVFSAQSEYQRIDVVDFHKMGRALVLDGLVQAVESDEFVYHETLVQTGLYNCSRPESAVILGGGDGGALREVLRCRSIKRVTMVDIDRMVVEASRKYLRSIHKGSFGDERVKLVFEDGREYLRKRRGQFDLIVVDVTEPIPSGPSLCLYSKEFYQVAKRALGSGGMLATHALPYGDKQFCRIVATLKLVFRTVLPFHAYVRSFVDDWGFALATDKRALQPDSSEDVDSWISKMMVGRNKYLTGSTYKANLTHSPHAKRRLAQKVKPVYDSEARRKPSDSEPDLLWTYR